jgi:regulator of protease activity HflC (stomatin/prohibitin superfamily)
MDAAFGWIGELLAWIVHFFPHLGICRATHGGVKFVRGKKVKPIRPGLYWYWPAVTEVVLEPVCRRPVDIPAQSLTTNDDITTLVSVTLVVEISDPVKAFGKTWDIDELIMDVGAAAATEIVPEQSWANLRGKLRNGITEKLLKSARNLLRPYGVRVLKARFTDFAEHTVIRHEGSGINAFPVSTDSEE